MIIRYSFHAVNLAAGFTATFVHHIILTLAIFKDLSSFVKAKTSQKDKKMFELPLFSYGN